VIDSARRSDITPEVVDVQPRDRRLVDGVVESERPIRT
jgi:hypothetical protein